MMDNGCQTSVVVCVYVYVCVCMCLYMCVCMCVCVCAVVEQKDVFMQLLIHAAMNSANPQHHVLARLHHFSAFCYIYTVH